MCIRDSPGTAADAQATLFAKSAVPVSSFGDLDEWDASDDSNNGNAGDINDATIRSAITRLDSLDVPSMGRHWVVPPRQKGVLFGIDRFTRYDAVGEAAPGNVIRNGMIGDAYGTDFYVSSNGLAGDNTGSTVTRSGGLFQEQALVNITQRGVNVESGRIIEYQGDAFVSSIIYKTGVLRGECGIPFLFLG